MGVCICARYPWTFINSRGKNVTIKSGAGNLVWILVWKIQNNPQKQSQEFYFGGTATKQTQYKELIVNMLKCFKYHGVYRLLSNGSTTHTHTHSHIPQKIKANVVK